MNNRDQETEVWRGPLILTVPAYGFVMALYLDWLGQSNRPFLPNHTVGDPTTQPRTARDFTGSSFIDFDR
jgi:hypothetical protein